MIAHVLAMAIMVYIIIGIYMNHEILVIAQETQEDNENYGAAQQVISNLAGFIGFSLGIFKWPRLMYIIYSGGNK